MGYPGNRRKRHRQRLLEIEFASPPPSPLPENAVSHIRLKSEEKALKVFWTAGMRVKMAMETDDSSRMTWFQGTLSSAFVPENGPWKGSPWRMLQRILLLWL
ncbi:putative auxin response factor [Rosa chinensis]|uniref:Putative auxin response factor n=1 Tax=Rosa chinensis TaxID=74649 RepID=A0A2P6SH56_ROSCH|nr:putative auxin response factor [Rosa chinensis]